MTINNEDIYDAVRESRVDINVCLERLDKLEKLIQKLSSQSTDLLSERMLEVDERRKQQR